jgi:hypothetical protein
MEIKEIIIHHTASPRDTTTLDQINKWHKERNFSLSLLGYYIGYHYVITANGIINQTRIPTEIGCHCVPNNGKLGIVLTGNFENEEPTKEQITSLERLITELQKNYFLNDLNIRGHFAFKTTKCPGKNLTIWLLRKKIKYLTDAIDNILNS